MGVGATWPTNMYVRSAFRLIVPVTLSLPDDQSSRMIIKKLEASTVIQSAKELAVMRHKNVRDGGAL